LPELAARRREELLAALASSALVGDSRQARALVGKLLRGFRGETLVDGELADALAAAARDFDTHPPGGMTTAAAAVSRAGTRPRTAAAVTIPPVAPPASLSIEIPVDQILVVGGPTRHGLDRLLEEQRRANELRAHGLPPSTRLLITGPPGVGKTQTARWLAGELRLPLARVEPARVMSSLLGESARNLREALDWARSTRCVLLVDEFDAFAKRRDDPTDVGELKRLVNMLLLELDAWDTDSLFVAATNHAHLLDPAVQRRFDLVIELAPPTGGERVELLQRLAGAHGVGIDDATLALVVALTDGQTGSTLRDILIGAIRHAVLGGIELRPALLEQFRPPMSKTPADVALRARVCAALHDDAGMSNRQIAEWIGLSNASVSELVRKGRPSGHKPSPRRS
jgi:DNA-binding NarL/FixJ family response regulator